MAKEVPVRRNGGSPAARDGAMTRLWERVHGFFGLATLRGTLRFYALLLVCLPLAMTVVLFLLFGRERLLRSELEQLVATLGHESVAVRSWMEERLDDARFMAGLDEARQGNLQALKVVFEQYVRSHGRVSNVVFVGPDGHTLVDPRRAPGLDVGDRDYFREARAGRASIAGLLVSRATGLPLCIVAAPVTDMHGAFGGAVVMPVELRSLDTLLGEAVFGRQGRVYLTDIAGRVLAPSVPHLDIGDWPMVSPALLVTGPQGGMYRDGDGREMLGACVDLGIPGWRLVRRMPADAALAGYRRQAVWVAGGALVAILLLTPLLLRLCRNLERPLEILSRYARELHSNRYSASCEPLSPKSMPQEMRDLYEAFCDMADDVRRHIEETERLSIQDHLTGLYNRRFLYAGGSKLLESAQRAGRFCSCLMIDVDHFKRVNDTYGHQTGDVVLHHVAKVIAGCTRKSDIVARYGGEEFAVLLTGAGLEQAVLLGERIRKALADSPCPVNGDSLPVTVSIGVAQARPEVLYGSTALDDLLARCDAAMYAAKAAGRNRVLNEHDVATEPAEN